MSFEDSFPPVEEEVVDFGKFEKCISSAASTPVRARGEEDSKEGMILLMVSLALRALSALR